MKLLCFLLLFSIIVGCKQEKKNDEDIYKPYKIYAIDFQGGNSKDICMDKKQIFHKKISCLKSGQIFFEVSKDEMIIAKQILLGLIDSCQKTKNDSICPKPIDYYYRQYIGYTEENHRYVYINLCAFYVEQLTKSTLLISDCYLNSVLTTKERGYIGHVIIDIDDKKIKDFHFEKYPEHE